MIRRPAPIPKRRGELFLLPATPNEGSSFDRLYLLAGDCSSGPVTMVTPAGGAGAPLPALAAGETRRLRIFHFNDLHNNISLLRREGAATPIFSQMLLRVERARRRAGSDEIVLFLSGGDEHTGTVLDELVGWSADEFVIDPSYEIYSRAGLDAGALGNHELDRGGHVLARGIRTNARFPILSANVHGSAFVTAGSDYFPAAIAVAKGLRIGLVGLTTTVDTRTHTTLDPHLSAARPGQVLRNLLPALVRLSDVIILLSHCGYGDDGSSLGKAGSYRHLEEGDLPLARALSELSDKPAVVIGAHTHTVLNERGLDPSTLVDGIPIVQAGGLGTHLGELSLTVAVGRRRAIQPDARLHVLKRGASPAEQPLPGEDYDAAFEENVVAPIIARVASLMREPLARAEADHSLSPEVTLRSRYTGECALANFICDAVLARSHGFPGGPVDLAITNATAIGNGIPPTGTVSYGQWYGVLPFADTLQVGLLSHAELHRILASNAKRIARPEELTADPPLDLAGYVSRGFLHFSRALRYRLRLGRSVEDAAADDITLDRRPLEPSGHKRLRVAFTNYLGSGGYGEAWNGQPIGGGIKASIASFDMRAIEKHELGLVLRNEVIAHIRDVGSISRQTGACLDGRVVVE